MSGVPGAGPGASRGWLRSPGLSQLGVAHGFATRAAAPPAALVRPVQVHGAAVAWAGADGACNPAQADAVLTAEPGCAVGVVTADCVPLLACSADGRVVAAIHAGWRGLAAGVVTRALEALRARANGPLRAAIGPHIGACCYEVDAPVVDALRARFGADAEPAFAPSARRGHTMLALAALAALEVERGTGAACDLAAAACTRCDARRFHSYRRDGAAAGRLVHFIRASGEAPGDPGGAARTSR